MPISEAELVEILSRNPSLKLFRPSTVAKVRSGAERRSEPQSPAEQPRGLNGNGSTDRQALQKKLALAMSEAELQQNVIDLAHLYSWKVAHFRSVKVTKKDGTTFWQTPVAADGEGFVDLVLARDDPAGGMGRVIFAECKKEREKPKPKQVGWLELLILTKRVEVYVFKPSQWLDGSIEKILM